MTTGHRKIWITTGAIGALLGAGLLAGWLGLSDGAIGSICTSIAAVAVAFCGGNGLEHVGAAIGRRSS